ncbi:sigma-70 family RNA polymerase sigma factor [Streptomyces radicis]|uniref:Sigma-70 family RNA polymerase sigma factor n=1 Tax=Streptomyces radicis TaxID=1750517 RepID=A0A3A9W8L1_9ACTN|nr:sigma-70 family RNA polymerase sigma factor [Streptomyces radicis]RKN09415.1 sigma-70 family RNA polymerase sigma factor [Streptomyces radicis]RKN22988.1 sigma-70 family RNA polymerase sigma factor [Streptomyces radicis]
MTLAHSPHHVARRVGTPGPPLAAPPPPPPQRAAAAPPAPVARAAPSAGPQLPAAERHRDRLLRYVNRLTAGDSHRAEDIVQETMLRAWLAADEFAGEGSGFRHDDDHLAAWLHIVARNLAVDAHRRDRSVPVGITPPDLLQRAADDADVAEAAVNRVAVTRSLARLGPWHRDVLVHVHLRDRSRADTARIMGIPQGTVKSRLHYALTALRREFAGA